MGAIQPLNLQFWRIQLRHPSTGVRASVCWLIQALICKSPQQSWQLSDTVEKLGTGENLHVRQNACVPLIEFAVRRHWRRDGSHIMTRK